MRALKVLLALALVLLPAACKHMKEIDEKLDQYEQRIAALEASVAELQNQMNAVQNLLSGRFFVNDVLPLEGDAGYKLVLTDSYNNITEYEIFNGVSPVVSVRQDTDGNWYWTVNGEWMTADGKKLRANGEAGATPQVKVEDGKWYVSIDGVSWAYAGEAVTEGSSIFAGIDFESDPRNVIFYLADGSSFTVPKGSAALKLQVLFDDTPFTEIEPGGTASTEYEIIAPAGITYSFNSYEPEGWVVVIAPSPVGKGTITVSLPEGAKSGKILFVLNGSDGSSFVRVVEVGVPLREEYTVDCSGGTIVILDAESLTLKEDAPWLTVSGNKVTVSANDGYDSRTAILSYTDAGGIKHTVVIIQAQKDAIVLTESSIDVSWEGGEIPLVVTTNAQLEVKSDVDWITVLPATKGMVEKPFTILVDSLYGEGSRKGFITFSCETVSQYVEVVQYGSDNPVFSLSDYGCVLGTQSRVYVPGKDQIVRDYSSGKLSFMIVNPETMERLEIYGCDANVNLGDEVSVSIDWKKGAKVLESSTVDMYVIKKEGSKVWLTDGDLNGAVIKL